MKRITSILSRNNQFGYKRFTIGMTLIAAIFLLQPAAFAQMKNKNALKENNNKVDTLNSIIIHQEVNFKVSPQQVYEALLSSKQFSESTKKSFNMFTAMSANIEPKEGGAFSVFDGHIIGRILELVPNQRIVQAWRVVDWPAGVYSIAKYDIKAQGSGTQLIFEHIGFPEGEKEHLAIGWQEHYWDALTKYFAKK